MPRTSRELQEEREANMFARILLMPDEMVRNWCGDHPKFTVEQIAEAFRVPLATATIRLYEIGISFDPAE